MGEEVGATRQRSNEGTTGSAMSETGIDPQEIDQPSDDDLGQPAEPVEENPDAEPVEEIEGDEDGDEPEQFGGEDDSEARRILTEKALHERYKKLDKANEQHAKRVGAIMEDDVADLIPCPVCMDGIAGWIYSPEAQQLSDEAILRLRQLIGLSGLEGVPQASFATKCPDCDGLGEVKTGSRVVGYETTTCERCLKAGWIRVGAPPTNGHVEIAPEPTVTGPTVYMPEPVDTEVSNLRARGWTVIPPLTVQNG